ncbi:MAG: hypothetical protein JXR03_09105 [Cyclobacteriaceae bacterium]
MVNGILFFSVLVSQVFNGWDTLSKLKIDNQYDELLEESFEVPVFSDDLLVFDGEEILIDGYVIPLQQGTNQDYFVLSRFPYNSCFFCGNAGPETVAEVYTKGKVSFKDEYVEVSGTLRLNAEDPLHLFYIIENASVRSLE